MPEVYSEEEVTKTTLEYFNGDELATQVWMTKYCLRDKEGAALELSPEDTLNRIKREFL